MFKTFVLMSTVTFFAIVLSAEDVALEINEQGQVGVNLTGDQIHPDAQFHVRGRSRLDHVLNLGNLSEPPENPIQGDIYLDQNGQMMLYFNSVWNVLATPTPVPVAPNEMALFKLDEQNGTIANNESDPDIYGSLLGGFNFDLNRVEGIHESALSFGGTIDHIQIDDHDSFSFGDGNSDSPFSLSCWFNTENVNKTQGIISKATSHNVGEYYILLYQGYVYFRIVDHSKKHYLGVKSDIKVSGGLWYHLAVTYDGLASNSGMSIYLNGEKLTTSNSNSGSYVAMENTNTPLFVGKRNVFFQGAIDEVQVDNHELTSEEVASLYNQ